jgi:hypothetical protein
VTEIVAVMANKEESFNNAVAVVVADNTAMIEMTAVAAVVVSLRKKDINTFDCVYIIEWLTYKCQPFFLSCLI